ncbi:MAG: hypothetical protein RR740_00775, partial [Pseudomonas sp.]
MNSSAALTFTSVTHDLTATIAQLRSAAQDQLERGLEPATVNYLFKGRISKWYSVNHAKIVSSARSNARKGSALEVIGKLTVSAYSSSSGMSNLTKGAAFKEYLEALPAAMNELSNPDLGRRAARDFDAVVNMITDAGEAPETRTAKRKEKTLLSAQRAAANAAYEHLLSAQSDEKRHELRAK